MFDNDNYCEKYQKEKYVKNTCMVCGSINIKKARYQMPNTNITRYTCNDCKEDFSVMAKKELKHE